VAIAPEDNYVYVSDGWDNSVSVINTAANAVGCTVGVGRCPSGLVVAPNGQYVYVLTFDSTLTDSPDAYVGVVSVISADPNTAVFVDSFIVVLIQLLIILLFVFGTVLLVIVVFMKYGYGKNCLKKSIRLRKTLTNSPNHNIQP
jgi:YVTN family beta-propeller protein